MPSFFIYLAPLKFLYLKNKILYVTIINKDNKGSYAKDIFIGNNFN